MDNYSYNCGVMDAFNEVIKAGVKKLALSHPLSSLNEALKYESFVKKICKQYNTSYYLEADLLITDLFVKSANINKVVYMFYEDPFVIESYLKLKESKNQLINDELYYGASRKQIAVKLGELLSYSDLAIEKLIDSNNEKE